jgi:hypothetical protein
VPALVVLVPALATVGLRWYLPGLWLNQVGPFGFVILFLVSLLVALRWRAIRKRRAATARTAGPAGPPLGD